jgi:methionine-rich copper-binding protein CopC
VPAAVAKKFTLAVEEDLKAGAYTVNWRAVGADTHVVSGDFSFTVAAATPL